MWIPVIVLAAALVMIAVEVARPGRPWPQVAGWWVRGPAAQRRAGGHRLPRRVAWDGWMRRIAPGRPTGSASPAGRSSATWSSPSSTTGGTAGGTRSDFLWRWFHQVHHSPQRIEIITSFYKHPFETVANSVLSSAILYLVVGVGPGGGGVAVLLTGLAELFYHWNVPTPYWLGYIIQRPESHCVHHQEGLHSYNYADLPLWDMLFGTFRNPRQLEARCGFGPSDEQRLGEMLLGVDVTIVRRTGAVEPGIGPRT